MCLGGALVAFSIVAGSWAGVLGGIAGVAVGAAGLPFALRIQRDRDENGPDQVWRERRGLWERVEGRHFWKRH